MLCNFHTRMKKTNETRQTLRAVVPMQDHSKHHYFFHQIPLTIQSLSYRSIAIFTSYYKRTRFLCICPPFDKTHACTPSIIVNSNHTIYYYNIYNLTKICDLIFKRISTCLNENILRNSS